MANLSEILRDRGYVYQHSTPTLEEITDASKRTVYLGVDPTADSIHVGNLATYMLLRHFIEAGHKVVLLIGGGTGMIGDPKPDVERPLTPPEVVVARAKKLAAQAKQILGEDVEVVNNYDWLSKINLIDFLRDIGKHFTVNNLMRKDAIAKRLESDKGITYTEFAYPLLQAYDFWHLFTTKGVDVQVSGSDQWGNVVAGVDLIRRKEGKYAYALTIPLIIDKATGKKFGKSEDNAVWLDPTKTSPFKFCQFWLNSSDESVEDYLKIFTFFDLAKINDIMCQHQKNPSARIAQRVLADTVTTFVHGENITSMWLSVSKAFFGNTPPKQLPVETIEILKKHAPTHTVRLGETIVDVLVSSEFASSKREAREFLEDGAIKLNGDDASGIDSIQEDLFTEGIAILKRGKRNVVVLTLQ